MTTSSYLLLFLCIITQNIIFTSLALHPLFIDHFHPLCTNLLVSTDSTNSQDARSRLNPPSLNLGPLRGSQGEKVSLGGLSFLTGRSLPEDKLFSACWRHHLLYSRLLLLHHWGLMAAEIQSIRLFPCPHLWLAADLTASWPSHLSGPKLVKAVLLILQCQHW